MGGVKCVLVHFPVHSEMFSCDGTANNEPQEACVSVSREHLPAAPCLWVDPCSVRSDGCCRLPPVAFCCATLRSTSGDVSLNRASGGDRSLLIFEGPCSLQLFT